MRKESSWRPRSCVSIHVHVPSLNAFWDARSHVFWMSICCCIVAAPETQKTTPKSQCTRPLTKSYRQQYWQKQQTVQHYLGIHIGHHHPFCNPCHHIFRKCLGKYPPNWVLHAGKLRQSKILGQHPPPYRHPEYKMQHQERYRERKVSTTWTTIKQQKNMSVTSTKTSRAPVQNVNRTFSISIM